MPLRFTTPWAILRSSRYKYNVGVIWIFYHRLKSLLLQSKQSTQRNIFSSWRMPNSVITRVLQDFNTRPEELLEHYSSGYNLWWFWIIIIWIVFEITKFGCLLHWGVIEFHQKNSRVFVFCYCEIKFADRPWTSQHF